MLVSSNRPINYL